MWDVVIGRGVEGRLGRCGVGCGFVCRTGFGRSEKEDSIEFARAGNDVRGVEVLGRTEALNHGEEEVAPETPETLTLLLNQRHTTPKTLASSGKQRTESSTSETFTRPEVYELESMALGTTIQSVSHEVDAVPDAFEAAGIHEVESMIPETFASPIDDRADDSTPETSR